MSDSEKQGEAKSAEVQAGAADSPESVGVGEGRDSANEKGKQEMQEKTEAVVKKGKDKEKERKEEKNPEKPATAAETPKKVLGCRPPLLPSGEHPLESSWTIWFDKKNPQGKAQSEATYRDGLKKLGSFSTIEQFWSYYAFLGRPQQMARDTNYHIFRENVSPTWESFPRGGCWILRVKKNSGLIGRMWEELVFACIGEEFEEPDVVGVELSIRNKEDLVSVWVSENRSPAVGEKWLETMPWLEPKRFPLEYKAHLASIKDHSTYKNTRPYVFAAQKAALKPETKSSQ